MAERPASRRLRTFAFPGTTNVPLRAPGGRNRPGRALLRSAIALVLAASPAQGQDLTDLCAPPIAAVGPDWLLSAELGAGANASISPNRPWRFSARVTPTWIFDRRRGLALGAMVGANSAQPRALLIGPRVTFRLKSLVSLSSFRLPGADLQGAVEYGYLIGDDKAHSLAATVGVDLVDLLRISIRGQHVFRYSIDAGRADAQSVFELSLGRSFTLHTPPPPPPPAVSPEPTAGFVLGRTEALTATIIPGTAATDTTPSTPNRCNRPAIDGLVAFMSTDIPSIHTRAELLAALRNRGLDIMAAHIDQFFPAGPEPVAVAQVLAGIRSISPP